MIPPSCHAPDVSEAVSRGYSLAFLIRGLEQRLLKLFSEGKLHGTVHTCIGQEWTGVALGAHLLPGDLLFSNHRGHGHYLALTGDVDGLVAEIMGRQTGTCGGRGGSQHLYHPKGFYSNGIQGGIVPVSAGLALALQLHCSPNIAVVCIGDGTLGEGAVYETLNLASQWSLPLLMVLENNLYAQSTHQNQTLAGDMEARFAAFGIQTDRADTWNPAGLIQAAGKAVASVRRERRPYFLRVDTYRLAAHSKGDDHRDPREVRDYTDKDPLNVFLRDHPAEACVYVEQADRQIDAAVAKAEQSPWCEAADSAGQDSCPDPHPPRWRRVELDTKERVVTRIHDALRRNMTRDSRIILLGEDIEAPYGGAFKVTQSLSRDFPGRVRNTSISEAAIVGIGNGLALRGFHPVCEIMFGDFITLAFDQFLNHAAKFQYMYKDQVRVPLIVRAPMGGKRGYGATHSQSLEKHFLGIPSTRVLAIHHRMDPGLFYDRLFETIDHPTLVIENKILYGTRVDDSAPGGFDLQQTEETWPVTRLRPRGLVPELTLLCYGGMLPEAEKAVEMLFDQYEVVAELICPLCLYPLDPWPIAESVQQNGRLLIVEEGQEFAAYGSEVVAQLVEKAPECLIELRRLGPPRHPIPSCGPLEKELLPGANHIVQAALAFIGKTHCDSSQAG